jgi:hypothetical protein
MMACEVTDLWSGTALPQAKGRLGGILEPHASLFVKLSACSEISK